jgi:hypothetical protein
MGPWGDGLCAACLAAVGAALGRRLGKTRRRWWVLGYFIPLLLVSALGIAQHWPAFGCAPGVSGVAGGWMRFALLSAAVPVLLITPAMRLPSARKQTMVGAFAAVVILAFGVFPLVAPAFVRADLSGIETALDADGVCLQQTGYTCGPAAAVTALRALGIDAEERAIALEARTNQAHGTQPVELCRAIRGLFGADGVGCAFADFASAEELAGACPVIALVKWSTLVDHWVAVLEAGDGRLVLGDPVAGKSVVSYEEFERRWRFNGIRLRRAESRANPARGRRGPRRF